jgi:esterase/lipase
MRKLIWKPPAIILCLLFVSCTGSKDTPSSIAKKWCELNGKAYKATEGPEKEAAQTALKQYENEMEAKHKDDEAFMKQVESEVEKCEDASEGR